MNIACSTVSSPPQQIVLPASPTVLRCTDTADFLAALPLLTGLTLEPGLFMVLFRGKRAQHAIRLDIPEATDPQTIRSFLSSLCSILKHTGAAPGRPALVLVTAEAFEVESTPIAKQWRTLADAILHRFRREGWKLREFAVVATDAWTTLLGEDAGHRRALNEISQSNLTHSGDLPDFTPKSLAELGSLPSIDTAHAQQIAIHLADLDKHRANQKSRQSEHDSDFHLPSRPSNGAPLWVHGAARVAGTCFDVSYENQSPDSRLLARLARLCETSSGWLVCAITALTRPQFVIDMFENEGAQRLFDLPLLTVATRSSPTSHSDQKTSASICDLLYTLALDRPDPGKLERVTVVLRHLAAHLPAHQRTGVLTLLAWAWWHIGMQSLAQRYIEQAQKCAPTEPAVQLVAALNESPPQWRLQAVRQPR